MPAAVADLLAALGEAFSHIGVRWYLFGAQAAIIHGSARLTGDVDVTVDLADHGTRECVRALRQRGFELRVREVDDFVSRTRVLPFVHRASGIPVDVVLAGPGIEEQFLERAEQRFVGSVSVPVAKMEDVVAMKVLAGRPKDLEDAVVMLASAGMVDVRLIRATLRLLEHALDQSDLIPQFDRALRSVKRLRSGTPYKHHLGGHKGAKRTPAKRPGRTAR